MIVVDTNIIAYLYLPTAQTSLAEALLLHDSEWAAPLLWRSEFRNVLALYLRQKLLDFDTAYAIQTEAESLLAGREYDPGSMEVLRLAASSGCSAYDCEFVATAQFLGLPLVSEDGPLRRKFRSTTLSLKQAIAL